MYKKHISLLFIVFVSFILMMPNIVNADMGNKPSITIKLKNMNSTDYIIDLLTQQPDTTYTKNVYLPFANSGNTSESFYNSYDDHSTDKNDLKNEPIYLYKEDGWMATAMRDSLLWGSVMGNSKHTNSFNYFGTPDYFKIIIQMPDGELRISDPITRKETNAVYSVDVNTMKVEDITKYSFETYFLPLYTLAFTIIIESVIAIPFFLHDCKKYIPLIIITNIFTNILLQVFMNVFGINIFTLLELLVFTFEAIVYTRIIKGHDTKKIVIYAAAANFITFLATYGVRSYLII